MTGFLFSGGPIHTMAGAVVDGTVLLTRGARIVHVGTEADLPADAGDAERVELHGRPLLPGLCDSHLHLVLAAEEHAAIDCRGADAAALEAFVREQAALRAAGDWITGFAWERRLVFPDGNLPAGLLDRAAPDSPVFLVSKDTHSAWLNSAGMRRLEQLARLPAKCVVQRDAAGAPTGLVLEDVLELRRRLVPARTPAEKRALLGPFIRQLHARGITAVHSNEPPGDLELVREHLGRPGEPRVRALWNLVFDSPEALRAGRGLFHTRVPGWLATGGAKLFLDGTLGSHTAALSAPYLGTDNLGMLNMEVAELMEWLRAIREVGTHGVFHAIGDRAVATAMDGLARLDWPAGTRHRLEHVQILPLRALAPGSLEGLVLSVQPSHMWDDRSLTERHLDAGLARRLAYPLRTMLERGGLLVFGSDAPVEGVDPWRGICAAVTRMAVDGAPPWIAGERLSLSEALQAHTAAPARLHGQAFASGVLAPGRLADLVVLAEDPFALEPAALRRGVPVDLTLLDGEPVYRRAP